MSANVPSKAGLPDPDDEPVEVLLIRVWRSGRGLRARLLHSGPGTSWVPITLGVTDDPVEVGRLVDAWLRDVSAG